MFVVDISSLILIILMCLWARFQGYRCNGWYLL